MNYTGNYMIDGDPGTSKGSPNYRGTMKVPAMVKCPDCKGQKEHSLCCGGKILKDQIVPTCSECYEECEIMYCDECNGTGQVEEKL